MHLVWENRLLQVFQTAEDVKIQWKMLTQGISLKLMSEMLRWEGQSIHNSCLRNQEMQILLGVTSEQMSADERR